MLSFKIASLRGFVLKFPIFLVALTDFESQCSEYLFSIYDLKMSHVKAKVLFYQFVGFGSQKSPILQVEQAYLLACLSGLRWGELGMGLVCRRQWYKGLCCVYTE